MALPLGPPIFHKAEAACPQWQDPPPKWSKLKPPECAGCLFSTMTKLPWCGKKLASSHEVFIAAKRGETFSVNQMESTEVGFFARLKRTLTKKRYRYCTVFVDHYSPSKHLRSLLPSTVSASNTITVMTYDFLTTPSSNHVRPAANGLPSVA